MPEAREKGGLGILDNPPGMRYYCFIWDNYVSTDGCYLGLIVKKDTRDILLNAATVVLSKNPGAPISDVADAAGIGRATLYRYFPSRDDLIRELTLESYRQMADALAPVIAQKLSGAELLLGVLEAIIPFGDRYYFLLSERTFQDDPEINEIYQQDENEWYALFENLKEEGIIASDVPTAWAISSVEAMIYSAWASVNEGHIARLDAPKLVYRTLLFGLGPISK